MKAQRVVWRIGGSAAMALLATAADAVFSAGPERALAADTPQLQVVELFQSQGCSDCPPANANLLKLVDRPDILALSFQVTYWDQLGWKDTFGAPEYTARQWDYARAWRRGEVATPEVVVNGRIDGVGSAPGEIAHLVARGARPAGGPEVVVSRGAVQVAGPALPAAATVWLVRYDPRTVEVPVQRGENVGRTLPHRNVVRELSRLGSWNGRPQTYALPKGRPGLSTAVLVQQGPGGPILAAARG